MFRLRNKETADRIIKQLKDMNLNIQLMHVCGTHQDTLVRYGLDTLFRECGVNIRQGPGCPVCVTTRGIRGGHLTCQKRSNHRYLWRCFQSSGLDNSLLGLRAEGHDVRIVYGIDDAVKIAGRRQTNRSVSSRWLRDYCSKHSGLDS